MATNFEKLQKLLEELFQLDQADLDFGIYRIMNQKRDDVVRFLEKDLLPQVKEAFNQYRSADKAGLQEELDKLVQQITDAGMNPDDSPKVKELRKNLADSSVDVTALENEVFSHLFNFFRRYYHEGDFISLRRYKEGVYAIPYEGEEVKLHWANHDQYYVKSSEYFRDYIFTMPSGKRVRVHLVAASSEQDNKKEQAGKERRFIICEEDPVYEENGELFIRFEYRSDDGKKKQDALNQEAIMHVLQSKGFEGWIHELAKSAPTKANPKRTVLEKHLNQYTARNTFDYFIHKDLGGFLRRELDFYIKNEVMHLDDIEHDTVPRVEQYLSKIKVIRKIAHKVIQFLEQLENFQKKLWLKKKFVVETNYCITLDRVPEELYPEIASNDDQREEWVRLFAIDKVEKDLTGPGYTNPLTEEFLKTNKGLILDTRYFSCTFKQRVLASIENLNASLDGLLVNGDNSQVINLLQKSYKGRIHCLYLDPPYNTNDESFIYKNDYKHSSWCAMMSAVLWNTPKLLCDSGVLATAIDDYEMHHLGMLCDNIYGFDKRMGVLVVEIKPSGRTNDMFLATSHEYYLLYAPNPSTVDINFFALSKAQQEAYGEEDDAGAYKWRDFLRTGGYSTPEERPNSFYPIYYDTKNNKLTLEKHDGFEEIWPIDSEGRKRVWRKTPPSLEKHMNLDEIKVTNKRGGGYKVQIIDRIKTGVRPKSVWVGKQYDASSHGTKLLKKMFGDSGSFTFPKSIYATADVLHTVVGNEEEGIVMDMFGGSGTTGHAVVMLNRKDGGNRRYVLAEVGNHFDTVLVPRMKKVHYAEEWVEGRPKTRIETSSTCVKYIRLENYDDTLNNLEIRRTQEQESLLDREESLREEYTLSYMLDVESRGSQSLLNVKSFQNPDEYKLRVERNGETKLVNVDLVETFNWLLGLTVKHIDYIRGVRVIEGTNPDGAKVLVLWRNLDETDNNTLDEWFKKQGYNTKDQEYDLIYVNGDSNLENLCREDQTWKVRLIEEEFGRLMFDVEDV